MGKLINRFSILLIFILSVSCANKNKGNDMSTFEKGTFGYDLNYLSQKDSLIVLKDNNAEDAQVIVSPKYQAKVFTSTAEGLAGKSLGYVNYKAIESELIDEHMNGYGGENRFWLGPEGGQFSVYFEPGKEQVYDNWHTPKPIDIEAWDLVSADSKKVVMKKAMRVKNYVGNELSLNVDRSVELISTADIQKSLVLIIDPKVKSVAYSTVNTITNLNDFEWTDKTGTICIWILDMFIPAPKAVTIIPFNEGDEKEIGKIATTDYFGEIPADRLAVKDNVMYLKTDGKYRSKLGMNAKRTKSIAGNYDPESNRLTITTYSTVKDVIYLNQEWNPKKDPLTGDAMNAYNDGPLEDGSIMGPFLEVESVSEAAFLKPNESLSHTHNVYHFVGDIEQLNAISEKLLGVSLHDLDKVF